MKILVLSSLIKKPDIRDSALYNFIERELGMLSSAGHDVHFFLNREKPIHDDAIEGVRFVNLPPKGKLRVQMVRIALRYFHYFLIGFILDLNRTVQIIKAEASMSLILNGCNFDIIHSHFLWPGGECCVLAAGENKVPVVATLRGAELRNNPEFDYGSMRSICYRYMFWWAKRRIACITAPNNELVSLLRTRYRISNKRSALVFNGVPGTDMKYDNCNRNNRLNCVSVGWFTELKNHQVVFDALQYVRLAHCSFTFIGEGPLHERYLELKNSCPNIDIQILGTQNRSDLLKIIAEANLLIHPSHLEGMPNVVLESLAVGTPVLASRISAHESIISHGYNGYLFDANSPKQLASIIDSMIGGTLWPSQLAHNCRRTAEHFSLEKKISKYEEVYQRAMENTA